MKPGPKTNLPKGPFPEEVSSLESRSPTETVDLTNLRSAASTQPSSQLHLEHNDGYRISNQHGEQKSTHVEDKLISQKEKEHQSKVQLLGPEIEELQNHFSKLSIRVPSNPRPTPVLNSLPAEPKPIGLPSIPKPRPLLDLLPAELKAVVLKSLDSFNDLYALTQASVAYYIVAQRYNIFTTTVLKDLDSRNISILPRDVSLPSAITELMFKMRVKGRPSAACDSDTLNWAFDRYYRQTRNGCTEIRLRSDECLALMSLIYVTIWEFNLLAHPGNLAHDVPQPRERIEHVIWMERDTDEEDTDEEDGTGKDFAATTPQAKANDSLTVCKRTLEYPGSLEIHRAEKDVADKKTSHCHRLVLTEPEDEWLAPSHQLCNLSSRNLVPYKKNSSNQRRIHGKIRGN
ncbi:hypothetical protein G7Y79_00030g064720 [Physcia stellaris]|nr:hypothetical protein G7Y79_00030g064720 [Physcia stellaris]